jgi:ABC-type antimicrobial peptide transport system permease subunit
MILKNLLRRKTRTLLTLLGISIGVAAILTLGVMTSLLENGYSTMLTGSQADLLLSQPDTFSLSYSAIDEAIGGQLQHIPEVSEASGMIQGIVRTPENPFFFVFGYPSDSFLLERFQIIAGESLGRPVNQAGRGKPLILGAVAAEALNKAPGDSLRLGQSLYRIVGIYRTGDAFEDRGAVIQLKDAQNQFDRIHKVSIYYIRLKNPSFSQQFEQRASRLWPDLALSSTETYANKMSMVNVLQAYVVGIAGLAILLGGVGMTNTQLMAVIERTREIGVVRALGWRSTQVLTMILGESVLVSLVGGILGVILGLSALQGMSLLSPLLAGISNQVQPAHLGRALFITLPLGLLGGAYPAWRASRLLPVAALGYEGGASGNALRRLPAGNMAIQSLWQRTSRTLLTLSAIGLTVGAILALEGVVNGMTRSMTQIVTGSGAEIMVSERQAAASSLSALDERIASQVSLLDSVKNVSRVVLTAITLPNSGLFMLQGYVIDEAAIRRFPVQEGQTIHARGQLILGRSIATSLEKKVGDTLELSGKRFRIVGIFETGVSWEEMGGVVTLADAQTILGKKRQVTMLAINVTDPALAASVVEEINARFPEARADLTGDFVAGMPEMQYTGLVINGISILAIFIGGLTVLNTMLMAVMERTREIGILRAVGWRRRQILGLILQESLVLGVIGGAAGMGIAMLLTGLMGLLPGIGSAIRPAWQVDMFLRSFSVALLLGLIGGLYPAYRATRLQPTEALRYE